MEGCTANGNWHEMGLLSPSQEQSILWWVLQTTAAEYCSQLNSIPRWSKLEHICVSTRLFHFCFTSPKQTCLLFRWKSVVNSICLKIKLLESVLNNYNRKGHIHYHILTNIVIKTFMPTVYDIYMWSQLTNSGPWILSLKIKAFVRPYDTLGRVGSHKHAEQWHLFLNKYINK